MADQTAQSDPIAEFVGLPREQQMSTLQQLSPEKQDKLLSKVKEYRSRQKQTVTPTPGSVLRPLTQRERFLNPNLYPVGFKGEGVGENLKNLAQRAGVGVFQLADAAANPGRTVRSIVGTLLPDQVINLLNKSPDAKGREIPIGEPNPIASAYQAVAPGGWQAAGNVAPMVGQILATGGFGEAATEIASDVRGVPRVAGRVGDALRSKYGPREIPVGDEKVPVTVGEAEPTSAAGEKATQLKRSGVGAKKFDKFEAVQQAKVKSAMRKLAQQTSGATGPMPEEPGAAMKYGADTVFETARPMYAALDEELVTVPGDLHSASAIVKQAIARAKKLGYDFEASKELHYGEEPLGLGKPVSDASHPLSDFQKIRSELGKMRRGSRDPAVRYQISEEMKQMTAAMDKALDNTGLKDTWKEADRLWAKGYAMNSIADALKSATKGAESAAQPKGIEVVPSEIKGASLEETLKDLSDDGTLERGLNHDEISNLRQSANILKRAEGTSTGSGYGESGSRSRAIAHILRGAPGPVAGAGIGGAIGMMSGHGFIVGAQAGGFAGFIVQSIGERALVSVMTKLDGVRALDAVADAKTPAEVNSAMTKLAAVAAASASKKRPGDLLRQAQ